MKQRTGEDGCPFNALYRDFVARNAARLAASPGMMPIRRTRERMRAADSQAVRRRAEWLLSNLDAR